MICEVRRLGFRKESGEFHSLKLDVLIIEPLRDAGHEFSPHPSQKIEVREDKPFGIMAGRDGHVGHSFPGFGRSFAFAFGVAEPAGVAAFSAAMAAQLKRARSKKAEDAPENPARPLRNGSMNSL